MGRPGEGHTIELVCNVCHYEHQIDCQGISRELAMEVFSRQWKQHRIACPRCTGELQLKEPQ